MYVRTYLRLAIQCCWLWVHKEINQANYHDPRWLGLLKNGIFTTWGRWSESYTHCWWNIPVMQQVFQFSKEFLVNITLAYDVCIKLAFTWLSSVLAVNKWMNCFNETLRQGFCKESLHCVLLQIQLKDENMHPSGC